jgi:SAM-dependent methyltransferase
LGWWGGIFVRRTVARRGTLRPPDLTAFAKATAGRPVARPNVRASGGGKLGPTYEAELGRIRNVFRQRDLNEDDESRVDLLAPGTRFLIEGRERAFIEILRDHELLPLGRRRVLDVGCGVGDGVTRFQALGVPRSSVVGLDLVPERLAKARARHAGVSFIEGNAGALPFADGAFDVVAQSTVFSSILDDGLRAQAAAEMVRVLKPGGVILWYDFRWNPLNRATRGVGLADLRKLFPDCEVYAKRVTLAPPLARPLAAVSRRAAQALEAFAPLRTHYCASLKLRTKN